MKSSKALLRWARSVYQTRVLRVPQSFATGDLVSQEVWALPSTVREKKTSLGCHRWTHVVGTVHHSGRDSCWIQRWSLSVINWQRSLVELSWQHLRQLTFCGKIFLSPEFGTKFQREVSLLWGCSNSLPVQCYDKPSLRQTHRQDSSIYCTSIALHG